MTLKILYNGKYEQNILIFDSEYFIDDNGNLYSIYEELNKAIKGGISHIPDEGIKAFKCIANQTCL